MGFKLPLTVAACFAGLATESIQGAELLPLPTLEPEANPPWVKLGPFEIIPRASAFSTYDDNVTLRGINIRRDFIISANPGFLATTPKEDKGILPSVALDYDLKGSAYMKYDEFNSLDHRVDLDALYPFAKLTLGLSHDFSDTTVASAELGEVINVRLNRTTLTSEYDISAKTSVELNAIQEISEKSRVSGLRNTTSRSLEAWLNNKYSQKFTYSAGLVGGFQDVSDSSDQTFQRALVRTRYLHSDLFEVSATLGAEFRQTKGGRSFAYPTYRLSAVYRPFPRTALFLDAVSQEVNSITERDLNYRTTTVTFTARQYLTEKWSFSLAPTYERLKANPLTSTVTNYRNDSLYGVLTSVDYQITPRWAAGAFYDFKEKSSTDPNFDFSNNRAGLFTTWKF